MPWRWVTGGRRSDKTMGNAVPGLWGGGNAASLMEARSMAESAIRDERAHARRGFAEMESAGERSDAEDGNVEIVGSKAQGHKISATEQLLAARAPGSIPEATDAKALGTIQESTAHTSPEQVAMLRRLGLNRVEVMGVLKSMLGSIHPLSPMRVIKYATFKEHGRIPRSNDRKTVLLSEVPRNSQIAFVSHRWLRPWHTREECEKNGHVWAGMAHPDDAQASKHMLICDGVTRLADIKGWDLENVYLWVDFAGVEQDDTELLMAGVASLRGYITLCDAILIPAAARPPAGSANTIDMVPGGYGERAWTRLEAMSMYAVSILKQVEAPEIYVAAGDGASFLEKFDYVLNQLPSAGEIFDEKDLEYVKKHEEDFLKEIKDSVTRNGYITKHRGDANCVAFDPKDPGGDLLVSGGSDKILKLVNRRTGAAVWSVETEAEVMSLAFSADGGVLAAGGSDGVVRVFVVSAGSGPVEKLSLTGHSGAVNCVALCPSGEMISSASDDGSVRIWTSDGEHKATLNGHTDEVFSVAFSPDGKTLASAGKDRTVRIWTSGGEHKRTLTGHLAQVNCVAFSPDGETLASGCNFGSIHLWTGENEEEKTLTGHSSWVNHLAFSPDSHTLASASFDGSVRLWNRKGENKETLTALSSRVRAVAWSLDGKALATANKDGTVIISTLGAQQKCVSTTVSASRVTCVAYSPDGGTLATASSDGTARLSTHDGKHEATLAGHTRWVTYAAWSPDSELIATCSTDGSVRLWNRNGEHKATLLGHMGQVISGEESPMHSGAVCCVAWSKDGQTLASASIDKTIRLWTSEGDHKATLLGHAEPVFTVAFSPDGTMLASVAGDKTIRLWTSGGQEVSTLPLETDIYTVAWSPSGDTLATAGGIDGKVRLWLLDGKLKDTLKDDDGESGGVCSIAIYSIAWSPNGETIAAACHDKTVRLWQNGSRQMVAVTGHSAEVTCVAWNPNGKTFATSSVDGTARLWTNDGQHVGDIIVTVDDEDVSGKRLPELASLILGAPGSRVKLSFKSVHTGKIYDMELERGTGYA